MGSYGINSAIEPTVGPADRPLYQKVAPLIREEPEQAVRAVQAGMTEDSSPAFDFLLGNLLFQLERYGEAKLALENAIRRFPDFRRAHRTLGFIQLVSGEYAESIDSWLKVIALGGGDAQSYGMLAYAYLTLEKYQSALSAYEMARIFNADSLDFRRGQAQCLLALRRSDEAIALFDELIAEHPQITDFWLLQANAYIEQELFEDAVANLEILQDLEMADRRALRLLADLHLRAGNYRLALKSYEAVVIQYGIDDIEAALRPLELLVRRGLLEEASSYLETLEQVLPPSLSKEDSARVSIARASLVLAKGQITDAIGVLEPIAAAFPLNGDALLMLADAYRRNAGYPEAEFYLERALSLPDRRHAALIALGRLRVEQGKFQAALEPLREAESLEPSPSLTRYIEAIEAAR